MESDQWKLGYVLANLELRESYETTYIAIVPFDDGRLIRMCEASASVNKLVHGFKDQSGRAVKPSALIYRQDAPKKLKSVQAWVSFRNCVALSSILPGWANVEPNSTPSNPLWSDFFDFYPVFPGVDESLTVFNPALHLYSSPTAEFMGMPAPHLRQPVGPFMKDLTLWSLLLREWEAQYIKPGTENWDRRKLFRSIEMAYRALAVPIKNESGIYDLGVSIALWVSAFEILAHPKTRLVQQTDVFDLLRQAKWRHSRLRQLRYRVKLSRNNIISVTLAERLYKNLYEARNAFLHGNPIHIKHVRATRRDPKFFLGNVPPVLYRTALMSYLGRKVPTDVPTDFDTRIVRLVIEGLFEEFYVSFLP